MVCSLTLFAGPSSASNCAQTLVGIQPAVTIRQYPKRDSIAFWSHDVTRNDGIIYVGTDYRMLILEEFLSERHLQLNQVHRVHNITGGCQRFAAIVRDRHLICSRWNNNIETIHMFNLDTDELVNERAFGPTYASGLLHADVSWVWIGRYLPQHPKYIRLNKLDPVTLKIVVTWETNTPYYHVGRSFVICGVMYRLSSSHNSPTHIKHIYNTRQEKSRTLESGDLVIPSVKRVCPPYDIVIAHIGYLHYDPWDRALYVENCGYLEKFPVILE